MTLLCTALRPFQPFRVVRQALAAGLASLILLGGGAAWADPPTRAGRIAEVAGTAWLFDLDTKAWVRVQRNQTIGQGDQLRTDIRSRVTLRVGSSTVWLDEQSDMEVLQMDDAGLALRLLAGDVALRLRTAQAAQETRVQTREGTISPEIEGLFRIDQLDRGSRLAVLQGRAQFDSDPGAPMQRAWLREGEQAEFWWAESPRVERQPLVRDKFSAWFTGRDQTEAGLSVGFSPGEDPYVSPEMTGAEDLHQYGNWETAVEYGNVWIPTRVAAGWEPYRDGNWVWTRQWGWSWVDNAPWGFAPFHYGRWVQFRGSWAWAPGRFEPRPAYSPALVAWVGGPQVTVGITIGGTRRPPPTVWVPLDPRQNYVPAYPHSPQYIERFRWNTTVINASRNDRNNGSDRAKPEPQRGDSGPQPYRQVPQRGAAPSFPNPNLNPNGNPTRPWMRNEGDHGSREDVRRDGQRDGQRNPSPVVVPVLPQMPPQVQPTQSRPQVPIFNRESAGPSQRPAAPQPSAQPPQPAPQMQQLPQQGPPQARPTDEEKPNSKRNKRESQDRDFR